MFLLERKSAKENKRLVAQNAIRYQRTGKNGSESKCKRNEQVIIEDFSVSRIAEKI